jgi:hypothetical protein
LGEWSWVADVVTQVVDRVLKGDFWLSPNFWLSPILAGFYVPLGLALLNGVFESVVHGRRGVPQREYFCVGLEISLGALAIVMIALLQWQDELRHQTVGAATRAAPWIPVLGMITVLLIALSYELKKRATKNAPQPDAHISTSPNRRGNPEKRIGPIEVGVALVVCSLVTAANSAIFHDPHSERNDQCKNVLLAGSHPASSLLRSPELSVSLMQDWCSV